MHLASINSAEEQKDLQDHIQAYGENILDIIHLILRLDWEIFFS